MSDFQLVDPEGWEWDLQSVYSAYMAHFQLHNIPWYDRTWGHIFATFEEFISFSWPVIVVTDVYSGRPHIVTRTNSIKAFVKMIRTRYGETIPVVDNMLHITPFESTQRHLRTVNDWHSYKKVHSTLSAAVLAALKMRVRSGEAKAIQELWDSKNKTFLAIDFEWSERNSSTCLEWGYASLRCGYLDSIGAWPPIPGTNYRKGHYIVAEHVDKIHNKHRPTYPWQYAFGDSQVVPKAKLPQVIQAVISSLASPDSESAANQLVLVAHGIGGDLTRLDEMKIKIPHNVLVLDTSIYERTLFNTGSRGIMTDATTGKTRMTGSTLSLGTLIHSLAVDVPCTMHNSGNDAFMCLLALQKLLDPENTLIPEEIAPRSRGVIGPLMGARTISKSPVGIPLISVPSTSTLARRITPSPTSSPVDQVPGPNSVMSSARVNSPWGLSSQAPRESTGLLGPSGGALDLRQPSNPRGDSQTQSHDDGQKYSRRRKGNNQTVLSQSMDKLAF